MPFTATLLPEFDQEMDSTRKVLERVPDGKWDWKPHPKSMTLGMLAGHISEMPNWATTTMETELLELGKDDFKPFIPKSNSELIGHFDEERKKARGKLENASDDEFQKTWTMKWEGNVVVSMPRSQVIRSMIMNHMIHHRGQLGVYLRLLDVPVPGVYGPSADEMPPQS